MRHVAVTFAGCFLGAGYVSGKELWQFFGAFGVGGSRGFLLTFALLFLTSALTMRLARRTGVIEMDRLMIPWEIPWLRGVAVAMEVLLLFCAAAIMSAGGGALLEQMSGVPAWCGCALMCAGIGIASARGLGGTVGIFSLVVPCTVAVTLIVGVLALLHGGNPNAVTVAAPAENALMSNWFVACLNFFSYNMFAVVGILAPLGREIRSGRTVRRGLALGCLCLFAVAFCVLSALRLLPDSLAAELPMLAAASALSRPLGFAYGLLLLLAMFSSAVSGLVAVLTYLFERFPALQSRKPLLLTVMTAICFGMSLAGFGDLISVIYPVFGYGSAVFIACLLFNGIRNAKKEKEPAAKQ